jgi:hypothetical protein
MSDVSNQGNASSRGQPADVEHVAQAVQGEVPMDTLWPLLAYIAIVLAPCVMAARNFSPVESIQDSSRIRG